MKKILAFLLTTIFLFGFDYKLESKKVTDGVWVFLGKNEPVKKSNGGNIANSYWVDTGKHWVVIDSGATYEYAKEAYDIMQKKANLPIAFVFNTHLHDDHWMGNSFYKEKKIHIYATKAQNEEYKNTKTSRILNILDKKDLEGTKIVKVDKIFDKNETLKVDNLEFNFIKIPYPAHTKEDFMVYLPSKGVLFTGDILMNERLTSIRHGSIEGNLKAIKLIEKINPKIYANGHGKFFGKEGIELTRSYLLDLKKEALKAIDNDMDINEFAKKADFSKYKKYYLYDVANKENLFAAYKEYEFFE